MKEDYFEGELVALNSVIGVCKHNPNKSSRELEAIFRDMLDQVQIACSDEVLSAYCNTKVGKVSRE